MEGHLIKSDQSHKLQDPSSIYIMATEDDEYGWEVHDSITELLKEESARPNSSNPSYVSIFMVPATLRYLNPTAYTPKIFSIGPLHKEDEGLKAMEKHKVTYMHRLFHRTVESTKKDIDKTILKCVQAVFGLVTRARACYAPCFANYDDFKFTVMMVVDGCFIIELLYRFEYGIAEGDPVFDNRLMLQEVKSDLLLLENQIPLFILKVLFRLTVKRILKSTSLTGLILYFFKDMNILKENVELPTMDDNVEHCHILGLLQSCYRPRAANRGQIPAISFSATEIAGAGITFKANVDERFLLAVIFKQSPLVPWLDTLIVRDSSFEIPVLCIKYFTVSFLRNLIAYEQCYPLSRHYVTSFAFLMDRLIETKDDVSLLVRSKVLQHNLGACEDVTTIFNNICNGVVLEDFYYNDQWEQVSVYCDRFWPSLLISLRNIYITTTWKTLTIIAAVVIFVLTLVQTIYTVLYA